MGEKCGGILMKVKLPFFKFKSHNHQSLELLYRLYHKKIYYYALYLTNDPLLAEDVTQEVFIIAYNKIDQLKDSDKVGAWLNRITTNTSYDFLRRRNKLVPVYNDVNRHRKDQNAENALLSIELQFDIESALMSLSQEHQEVIYLKYIRGLTSRQISELLEIPEGTVKSRLRKARETVANRIALADGGDGTVS